MSKLDQYVYRIFQGNGAPEETPQSMKKPDFSDKDIRDALTPGPGTVEERLEELQRNINTYIDNHINGLPLPAWTDARIILSAIVADIRKEIYKATETR